MKPSKYNIMDGMDRVRAKRSLWKQRKFWVSVAATLFLIIIVIMLLGKNVSTVRTEKDKISMVFAGIGSVLPLVEPCVQLHFTSV